VQCELCTALLAEMRSAQIEAAALHHELCYRARAGSNANPKPCSHWAEAARERLRVAFTHMQEHADSHGIKIQAIS
jgi:hypothetical protein